ncbi:flagellar basal body protein, partial [Rhizobium ruizarguesonis]
MYRFAHHVVDAAIEQCKSIFGSMKTAVSGMNAQANRLSTVDDNIANVKTTG